MNPLVTISIPIFKCEKFIIRCLESVKNQTYKNLEIVLVNDCTPDDSMSLVKNFMDANPDLTIKIIEHQENSGLSVVRNNGIKASTGKYLFFLDSDDEITTDCIELLVKKAEKTDAQIIIAQNRWINTFDNTTKDFGFPTITEKKYYDNNLEIFSVYSKGGFPSSSWNKLFKKDFIVDNQIYFVPGLFAQDELWFFHLLLKTDTLAIIDDITYLYYLHGESVIFNRQKKNFENYLTILEYLTKSYKEEKNSELKMLIKNKIILFKEMVLVMQWKALKDKEYLKTNISRMQKLVRLNLSDYLSSKYSLDVKKKNFFHNIPAGLAVKLFIWRFER
ncbi:glycosyltransferase family 2 protein [Chryseobacterium indoltheticum]|uniref:Chondroitin polymerase n=1 Tax=Chryseobacterium indoltheticum TaxID=254 RepID=A0A381F7B8_9FLAO|nr:glycosyltransferase [Chryseobacterium indoltheticum]AZA72797.1 glycosyltransferase [Chryseobacterium indoltheticum]SIP87019.1 Glycosyltransferase involved in cell wall bisynthesis [Chryseobacterium indoltheticum]SUX42397.1 Chondroitin polymerase [Chryseobacterium indoltheticum]